jgi:hypothetical protein
LALELGGRIDVMQLRTEVNERGDRC